MEFPLKLLHEFGNYEMFQVEYSADSLKLDILELARTSSKLVSIIGKPDWMCQAVEVADPVTFSTPDTVLVSFLLLLLLFSNFIDFIILSQ